MSEAALLEAILAQLQDQAEETARYQAIMENLSFICEVLWFIAWLLAVCLCFFIAYKTANWLIIKPIKYWLTKAFNNIF